MALRTVFEQHDALLLQRQPRLLGDEQVCSLHPTSAPLEHVPGAGPAADLDDELDFGLALLVEQLIDVADVDGLWPAAAGDEDVGLVAEMGRVAELSPIGDPLAAWCAVSLCLSRRLVRMEQAHSGA